MTSTGNRRWVSVVEEFFTSWRFPVFMLATLGFTWVMIMFMAWVPVTDSQWGAFAEDFKVWCFGYDPETGSLEWIYLVMFTGNPLMLAVIIGYVWNEPLGELWAGRPGQSGSYVAAAGGLVLMIGLSFLLMYDLPGEEPLEFRAEAIRTSYEPPDFTLINEHEEHVTLSDYSGRVVLLTSIYASCSDTCPMILDQAKAVLDALPTALREEVVLMAISMQPEKDTPELLSRIAEFYRLDPYNSHLLTGDPELVHRTLDRLDVARNMNRETGVIDHANLFMLIDRKGKIAFRFTLGDLQAEWMKQALEILIHETGSANLTELYGRSGE